MPQIIPIQPIPNQESTITLDDNFWDITIKATDGVMSVGMSLNGNDLLDNVRCAAGMRLIPSRYEESGNFIFATANQQLPSYTRFNITQSLLYFSAAELAAIRLPSAFPITSAFFNPIAALPPRFAPQNYELA